MSRSRRNTYANPTMETAHRNIEADKRKQAKRRAWSTILRKRQRIQRLVKGVLGKRR